MQDSSSADSGPVVSPMSADCARRALSASVVAASSLALLEAVWLLLVEGGAAAGVIPMLWSFSHVLGLAALVGPVLGLAMALVLPSTLQLWRPLLSPRRAAELPGLAHHRAAADLTSLLLCAGVAIAVVFAIGPASRRFARESLVAPYLALVMVGGLLCGGLLFVPLRRSLRRAMARATRSGLIGRVPLTLAVVLAALALGHLLFFALIGAADLGAYDLRPLYALLLLVMVALAIFFSPAPPLGARPLLLVSTLILSLSATAVFGLQRSSWSMDMLPRSGYLSRASLVAIRHIFDRDGDGASALLGGGDCDDTDPAIGPHARDIPGNGTDENCHGGDASLADPADSGRLERAALAPARPLSIVLLMVDTLRSDRLGGSSGRVVTPVIDAWAEGAFRFEQTRAQAPNTPRSFPSILTGRYPSRIRWKERFAAFGDIDESNELLWEIFADGGWRTEAVSANFYFDLAPGVREGVERWENGDSRAPAEAGQAITAPEITAGSLRRLDALAASDRPFVFFAHYFEPHAPYIPHPDSGSGPEVGLRRRGGLRRQSPRAYLRALVS